MSSLWVLYWLFLLCFFLFWLFFPLLFLGVHDILRVLYAKYEFVLPLTDLILFQTNNCHNLYLFLIVPLPVVPIHLSILIWTFEWLEPPLVNSSPLDFTSHYNWIHGFTSILLTLVLSSNSQEQLFSINCHHFQIFCTQSVWAYDNTSTRPVNYLGPFTHVSHYLTLSAQYRINPLSPIYPYYLPINEFLS